MFYKEKIKLMSYLEVKSTEIIYTAFRLLLLQPVSHLLANGDVPLGSPLDDLIATGQLFTRPSPHPCHPPPLQLPWLQGEVFFKGSCIYLFHLLSWWSTQDIQSSPALQLFYSTCEASPDKSTRTRDPKGLPNLCKEAHLLLLVPSFHHVEGFSLFTYPAAPNKHAKRDPNPPLHRPYISLANAWQIFQPKPRHHPSQTSQINRKSSATLLAPLRGFWTIVTGPHFEITEFCSGCVCVSM